MTIREASAGDAREGFIPSLFFSGLSCYLTFIK